MKAIKILSFLVLFSMIGNAQSPRFETAMKEFQENYNAGNAEAIFNSFEASMQEKLPIETTTGVISTLQKKYGKITKFEYRETRKNTEKFFTVFENGTQNIFISLNEDNQLSGLLLRPVDTAEATPKFERNITKLQLPFKEEWFVVWGGDNKAQNYHVIDHAQRRAFDILMLGPNNKTYERSGTRNEDYYAFGKPMYAVCDAVVLEAADGNPDNKPGDRGSGNKLGNYVLLKTANNEYIYYAHFRNGSVKVKKGDAVKKGQQLGECGNSGNSSEVHLHIHMQDSPDIDLGVGVQMHFEEVKVGEEIRKDYSPVRLDRITRPEE